MNSKTAESIAYRYRRGISKFRSLIPIYGVAGTVGQMAHHLFGIELQYRFEKNLLVPDAELAPKIPLRIVPLLGTIDVDRWGLRDPILEIRGPYGLEQLVERLRRGYVMFCAYSADMLAGFIWLCPFPVTEAGYAMQADEAYHIDGWTFETFRGKGVLPALQQGVMTYLRRHHPEIRILVGHANTLNKSSVKGQHRAGFVTVAEELSLVVLGHQWRFRLRRVTERIS